MVINKQRNVSWITGANGLIGNYLVQTAAQFAPHWTLRVLTREQFDLLDFNAVFSDAVKSYYFR